jgi:APA family basic amino acid/polyamine antiporter
MIPILASTFGQVSPAFTPVIPDVPGPASGFGVAMIAVMWTYEGWHYVAFVAGEIKDPQRNVPRALIVGTLILTVMYVLVNLGYLYALTLEEMRGVVRIAERAAGALLGAGAGSLVAAMVSVSTFGCNAAGLIGTTRVCYAMAADGLFFRAAARVHPVYRTPHIAILMTCVWGSVLCLSGSYQQLFTYVIFGSMLFFVAGGLAIFRLRRIAPDLPRPYRTWGYPVVPAVFVAGSLVLVINTLLERPTESLAGLGLVALGIPAYWYFRRQSREAGSSSG